jgi:16S rRNA processing protein RimM
LSKSTPQTEPYPVGRIVGAFGLRGEVKVEPLTDFIERLHKGARLRLKGEWVTVESFRLHKNRPLLRLTGVEDATAAEALQWQLLESVSTDRPELEEDEFMTSDLIGCQVVTSDGRQLGPITDVLVMPAHDVLQVGSLLIPAVKEFVKQIDLEAELITVELIPGMLED